MDCRPRTPRRFSRSCRGHDGAAAVEFALVVPLLVMLVLGTITTGVSYSHALGVTNAVREGARFGATTDATSASSWASDVVTRVRQTQFDDPANLTAVCAEFWEKGVLKTPACSGTPATALAEYPLPSGASAYCVVRVVATREFKISAPPLLPGIPQTMARGAVVRYERTDKVPACE